MAVISENIEYRLLTVSGQVCFASNALDVAQMVQGKRATRGVQTKLVKATTVVEELPDG